MYTLTLLLCIAFRCWHIYGDNIRDGPWTKLPNMDDFCPGVDVCRRNTSNHKQEIAYEDGYTACCKECSCEDDCGINGNCCFPQLDKYNITGRDQQQCVLPSTTSNNQRFMHAYYMVADNPLTGCQSEIFNLTAQSEACGDQIIAPWGNLFPVYSKKTGILYKNERCAICHGVSDWIRWDAILQCERFDSGDNAHAWSIPDHIKYLEFNEDASYSHCSILFQYPGALTDIKYVECFDYATDVCYEHFEMDTKTIKSRFNITQLGIVEGCASGLLSPFTSSSGWYKNVFCFLCNQPLTNFNIKKCKVVEKDTKTRGNSFNHFVTLLNNNYIEYLQKTRRDTKDRPLACEKGTTFQNRGECRTLHCPSGQLYFPDGICRFPSKRWYDENLSICIKLNPENAINLSAFKAMYRESFEEDQVKMAKVNKKSIENKLKSKFLKNWIINEMYQEHYSTSFGESLLKKLFIVLVYKPSNKSPEEITKSVKTGLEELWTLTLNESSFQLVPEISEYCTLKGMPMEGFRPLWVGEINSYNELHTHISTPILWEVFIKKRYVTYTFITKMFFCKQIQLNTGEFVFDETKTLLYVNTTGTILFENEFQIIRDGSGVYVPRICLYDSAFKQIESFSNAASKGSVSLGYTIIAPCLVIWRCFSI